MFDFDSLPDTIEEPNWGTCTFTLKHLEDKWIAGYTDVEGEYVIFAEDVAHHRAMGMLHRYLKDRGLIKPKKKWWDIFGMFIV